jgi:hypothetical protein
MSAFRGFLAQRVQPVAEITMVLGIVALCQPWNLLLHRYGLTIIILGLIAFMLSGWVGKHPSPQEVDPRDEPGARA